MGQVCCVERTGLTKSYGARVSGLHAATKDEFDEQDEPRTTPARLPLHHPEFDARLQAKQAEIVEALRGSQVEVRPPVTPRPDDGHKTESGPWFRGRAPPHELPGEKDTARHKHVHRHAHRRVTRVKRELRASAEYREEMHMDTVHRQVLGDSCEAHDEGDANTSNDGSLPALRSSCDPQMEVGELIPDEVVNREAPRDDHNPPSQTKVTAARGGRALIDLGDEEKPIEREQEKEELSGVELYRKYARDTAAGGRAMAPPNELDQEKAASGNRFKKPPRPIYF